MSDPQTPHDNDVSSATLDSLRTEIDIIDNDILRLLAKRQNLSRAIATKKVLGSNVFRPDREVSLLRNLVASHQAIDPRLIMGLWRHIISASIAEQKSDYTIAHSPLAKNLATTHSAGYMQTHPSPDAKAALLALKAGQVDCVIITTDELTDIQDMLGAAAAHPAFIAASIGFLDVPDMPRGYIICRELPASSGNDQVMIRGADNQLTSHLETDPLPDGVIIGKYATPLSYRAT